MLSSFPLSLSPLSSCSSCPRSLSLGPHPSLCPHPHPLPFLTLPLFTLSHFPYSHPPSVHTLTLSLFSPSLCRSTPSHSPYSHPPTVHTLTLSLFSPSHCPYPPSGPSSHPASPRSSCPQAPGVLDNQYHCQQYTTVCATSDQQSGEYPRE